MIDVMFLHLIQRPYNKVLNWLPRAGVAVHRHNTRRRMEIDEMRPAFNPPADRYIASVRSPGLLLFSLRLRPPLNVMYAQEQQTRRDYCGQIRHFASAAQR